MQAHPPPEIVDDLIDEESDGSFPASDSPSFSGMHAGTPCPEMQQAVEALPPTRLKPVLVPFE